MNKNRKEWLERRIYESEDILKILRERTDKEEKKLAGHLKELKDLDCKTVAVEYGGASEPPEISLSEEEEKELNALFG